MAKLTPVQVSWACEQREAGRSHEWIARRLKVSPGAINYQCLKNGAFSPRQRRQTTPAESKVYQVRDGVMVRTFTPDEDERLLQLARGGMSARKIAREMDRARTSVIMRLMLLEMREELPA